MLNIGICDDCIAQVDLVSRYIDNVCNALEYSHNVHLIRATDPCSFLKLLDDNTPDILFLDIDMGTCDGISLGEIIKGQFPEAIIIYVTGHSQYALDAFKVRAFHYILKPVSETVFSTVFIEAIKALEIKRKHISQAQAIKRICVQRRGATDWIDCREIYFFEKVGHKVKIHTSNGNIDYHISFRELLNSLEHDIFLQCHQGYIVNLNKLRAQYQKELLLDSNYRIPISRTFAKSVKDRLARRLFSAEDSI